jgi:hypothetical protein
MTTLERIDQDFKEAMRSKDEVQLSVLRLMRTALKNKQIELMHELSSAEADAVLRTMIKQYQDALADFSSANRQDLVERQQKEIDIVSQYLPPAIPAEELEKIVRESIAATGADNMGKAMGAAMKAVAGRADGNAVRAIVEQVLKSS